MRLGRGFPIQPLTQRFRIVGDPPVPAASGTGVLRVPAARRKLIRPRLNRQHPTAKGLHGAWFSAGGNDRMRDYAGHDHAVLTGIGTDDVLTSPFGPAVEMTTTAEYATLASDGQAAGQDFQDSTLSVWVYPNANQSDVPLYSYDFTSYASPYYARHLHLDSSARIYWSWNNGSAHYSTIAWGGYTPGEWQLITCTFRSGQQRIWNNGVMLAETTRADTITFYAQEVWMGKMTYSAACNAIIASCQLWNRVLTDNEIVDLYRDPWAMWHRQAYFPASAAVAAVTGDFPFRRYYGNYQGV